MRHELTNEDRRQGNIAQWGDHVSNKIDFECIVCGKEFRLWPSDAVNGRGKYCSPRCRNQGRGTKRRYLKNNGYWYIRVGDKEKGTKIMAEHRYIVEKTIGRKLTQREVVHHIDEDKKNNAAANLFLCRCEAHHRQVHKANKDFLRMLAAARYLYWPKLEQIDATRNCQEDIQEMWEKNHPDHKDGIPSNWGTLFIDDFYEWVMACEYDKSLLFAPIVSLQLAFYMQEIHNKRWTDEGWVDG